MSLDAAPHLRLLARINVRVGAPVELGDGSVGSRRIIPIVGGTVSGPELRGEVLHAGADFQLLTSPTLTHLEAKYAVRTEDGEFLSIDNRGIRAGEPEDIAALVRGEAVDPSRIYFRCAPTITSSGPKWAWLASRVLVATGVRLPDEVRLTVYVVE